jgi:ribonuclease G
MQQEIFIHSAHHETRVVVMEHGAVQELHVERHSQRGVVGNVYTGKVIRVLPGMQSVFIDVGLEKAAFLHVADLWQHKRHDVNALGDKLTPIEKLMFPGQTLLVQVLKDPLGTKGARLTTQISLAGRYMVLLPQDSHIGLSQKISDEAHRRDVRERLNSALPNGFEFGLIARTQAQDASTEQLASDIEYLNQVWHGLNRLAKTQAAPALLHQDADLAERALRDLCTEHTLAVQVDGAACFKYLHAFAEQYMPAVLPRLKLHKGEHGLFDLAQVDAEVNAALQRRVNLKSGAYLVIDQTESMCTIDVNTGSYVGSKNFAETLLKTNLEAATAIARQLRLRNLGGIILVDFIDMASDEQREQVRVELMRQLARDPVRSQIHGFTALGLMELTRKRVRESLAHVMLETCDCCAQTGQVKTAQTIAYDILREIELQARQFNCKGFELRLGYNIHAWFDQQAESLISSLEKTIELPIDLVATDSMAVDQYQVVVK